MHQPQANQLTLNEFQGSNSETNLGRYLLEIFKKFNKFINLWVVNLSCPGSVFKIFTSLNIVLILTILALFAFGIRTWVYPKYPDKVDGENLLGTSRELAPLEIARQNQPPQGVNEVVSKNLFRKERDEYLPPPQPSIAQVDKIVGPGSPYTVAAQQQVFGQVGIALLPGPSEIVVLADANANPVFVMWGRNNDHGAGTDYRD